MEILARAGLAGLVWAAKATLILAAGFLVFRALPRRSASARHLAALLALLGAALVPALTPVLPRWEWRVLPAAAAAPRAAESSVARTPRVSAAEEPKIFLEGEEGKRPREGNRNATIQAGPSQPSKNAARSAGPGPAPRVFPSPGARSSLPWRFSGRSEPRPCSRGSWAGFSR